LRYCRGELDNLLLWVELKALFAFDDLIYWKKNPEGVFYQGCSTAGLKYPAGLQMQCPEKLRGLLQVGSQCLSIGSSANAGKAGFNRVKGGQFLPK